MALPRKIHKTLTYYSCFYQLRGAARTWSSRSGSRFVSSPVDDKEDESVIRRMLRKSEKNRENISETKIIKETLIERKTPENAKKNRIGDQEKNYGQTEIRNLMKGSKYKNICYIVGQDAADTLVKHVKKDLREGDVIAEAQPGIGILTSTLLSETSHKVIGFEPISEMFTRLQSQNQQHASRFELHCLDLLRFYWYYILDKKEPERDGNSDKLAQLLDPLPIRGDQGVSRVKIVTSVIDMSIFHKLSLSFTFQCCFYKDVFPVFYMYIPEKCFGHLTSSSRNMISRRLRFPFVYYFELEHLDTAPKSSFYSPCFRKKKHNKNGDDTFHLVKITPRENVYETVPKQELENFHYFMKCLNNAKSGDSLISYMERWIPGCGIDYIENGFRMFTHPRELTEEQLLEAYRLFVGLPSFKECMFHHLCENWTVEFGLKDKEIPVKLEAGNILGKEVEIIDDVDDDDDDEFADIKGIEHDDDEFADIKGHRTWKDRGL